MRKWADRLLIGCNIVMFIALFVGFMVRGFDFKSPWDGPAVATIALAAATLILGAVALGVGLLAVWGYATLREHAETIAKTAADAAAEEAVKRAFKAWVATRGDTEADDLAKAYGKE